MSGYRKISGAITIILTTLVCAVMVACGGSAPAASKPTPTPTPTPGPGARLLRTTAQKLNTASSLHGLFNVTLSGQTLNGMVNSEIWNVSPNKNRTLVRQSTISQFATGSVTVTNGKQIWQYDPEKKVVYTGKVTPDTGTPTTGSNGATGGQSQFILNLVQSVFTRSDATLVSSSAKVHGHDAYDVHVVPQSQTASRENRGTPGNFNYTGEVYIDKATTLPLQVNLNISGLGQVLLDIPMLVLNSPIPESTFTFVVPAGVKVLPLQQENATPGTGSLTLAQAESQAGYHLLSIPSTQTDYQLQDVTALGSPGNQIYTLNYMKGSTSFTIAEGKALANLPTSGGQTVKLRGTTGTLTINSGSTTLSWTEKGVGVTITGALSNDQIVAIANLLA
jgi:outer membrane lipoprotein-sorting protein